MKRMTAAIIIALASVVLTGCGAAKVPVTTIVERGYRSAANGNIEDVKAICVDVAWWNANVALPLGLPLAQGKQMAVLYENPNASTYQGFGGVANKGDAQLCKRIHDIIVP